MEESGIIGNIQGGLRMERRANDNLFMLERMIKVSNECLFVTFIDMEKVL